MEETSKKIFGLKPAIIYWIIAFFITVSAMIYQKMTGPTYPMRVKTALNNKVYNLKLLRSSGGDKDCKLEYHIPDVNVKASVFYKRYKSQDEWTKVEFVRDEKNLVAHLPWQPPAGKLAYYIQFRTDSEENFLQKENPVVVRFKGGVPNAILIPHVIFMILTLLFSMASAVFALAKHKNYKLYGYLAFGFLLIGGMILGPIVQKYAFNELWAGVPFGWDLTDNKTLIMFIAWGGAIALHHYKKRAWYFIAATFIVMMVYAIPHSAMGSELNYETGKIGQSELNE